MYKSYEFSIEVWPGTVRIHQGYDTEDSQTIELDPSQVESFYEVLKTAASESKSLGDELEAREREVRLARANRAGHQRKDQAQQTCLRSEVIMSDVSVWREYHRRCDAWIAKHGYGDERAFLDFVRRLTAELGI